MISLGVAFFPYISMPTLKILAAKRIVARAVTRSRAAEVSICQRGTAVRPLRIIIMAELVKGKMLAKTAMLPSGLLTTGPIKRKASIGSIITIPWELPALCRSSMVAPRPTKRALNSR